MSVIGEDARGLIPLWMAWRGNGMAPGHLPFAGGTADQPAIVIDAFHDMEAAAAQFTPRK